MAKRFGIVPGEGSTGEPLPTRSTSSPQAGSPPDYAVDQRLAIFDQATERQEGR